MNQDTHCSGCGEPVADTETTCPQCGWKLKQLKQSAPAFLVPCKTCGRQVSSNAASCPHCGEKLKAEQTAIGLLAAIIIALIIGGVLYALIAGSGG